MNIYLNKELAEFVDKEVASGRYTSEEEALQLFKDWKRMGQVKFEELKREIAIGIEQANQGRVKLFDDDVFEGIKARVRKRLAARKKKVK